MLSFLNDLIGGWRELRTMQGYSYQISRNGKRRVMPVEDYGRRGAVDEVWLMTGKWGDEAVRESFNKRRMVPSRRGASVEFEFA